MPGWTVRQSDKLGSWLVDHNPEHTIFTDQGRYKPYLSQENPSPHLPIWRGTYLGNFPAFDAV